MGSLKVPLPEYKEALRRRMWGQCSSRASRALRAGELRRLSGVKAGVSYRARWEEVSAAWLWRAVGDSLDCAARTPRAVGRPVGSKEPEEASRRFWDCGIRGGRDEIDMGGEIWPGLCHRRGLCTFVSLCGSMRTGLRPNPGWIRV